MWVERKPGWRVGWDSRRPDRVPDVLGNFLRAVRGEAQSLEGQSTGQLWPYPGPPAKGTVFIVTKCHSTQGRIFKDSLDEWKLLVAPCFPKCVMTGI